MSETLQVLNNIRTLRAQARELPLEVLEELLENSLRLSLNAVKKKRRPKQLIESV